MNSKIPRSYFKRPAILFLLLGFLTIFLAVGCATPEKKLRKGDLTLSYRHKTRSAAEVQNLKLAHPAKVSKETVARHMLALVYSHNAIFSEGEPVFTAQQVGNIHKTIAKALNKASPENIIYFELDSAGGETAVELFVTEGGLNWKFTTVRGVDYSKNMLKGWGSTWRLIPGQGQGYFESQKMLGKKTWENWIVAKLNLPKPDRVKTIKKRNTKNSSKKKPAKKSKPQSVKENPELEKKLQVLKNLHDKGLIDDDEHKEKRKELLDQHF